MKLRSLKLGICAFILAFRVAPIYAQNSEANPPTIDEQTKTENACRQIPMRDQRTYLFRKLPQEKVPSGVYGPRTWYQKIFPFLFKQPPKSATVEEIEKTIGRPIPFGETKRSQKIRLNSEAKLIELQKNAEENWQSWLRQNPNAAREETESAAIRIRSQGLAATTLERFDWRKHELDVGEVGDQGFRCQSCWAFSSVDAMQISRRLIALRAGRTDFDERLLPSVQQLISCMSPDRKDYCDEGWHGKAFTFMVDKGLPLGGPTYYNEKDFMVWTCDPSIYVKALTWDFVSPDPRKVSTVEEIKRTLILYGPVVTMIHFDKCLWLYGGGTFNGENNGDGSHFVIIIGWDDKKDGGAWLVKNSFGKDWGENGFGWIKYGSNNIGESSAWLMADPKEEERIAQLPKEEEQ